MVLKLFRSVTSSTWLPMYDFDFWILPYLEGKGMTPDQIQRFVNACDDLLSMEIDVPRGKPVTDPAQAENNLRQICGEIGENKNVFAAH
jgi:p-methyltransferase